ncbi:MAG: AMP-dependent synthetase, partial [Actinomycetes bacterium]
GWWAARASVRWQQLLVSAVIIVAVPGYWGDPVREGAVVAGLLVLVWLRTLRVPRDAVPLLTRLAAASLAIYLTHWTIFPLLESTPALALVVSLAFGVGVYELARAAVNAAKSRSFWSAYALAYSASARSQRSLPPR